MVPTLTCGLSRSNFSLATAVRSSGGSLWVGGLANQGKLSQSVFTVHSRGNGLARAVLDDLLGDVRRDLVVALELHRVGRAPLRVGAEVCRVAEHLAQRDVGGDRERVAASLLALQAPAPAAEVADDVAEEVLGGHDLDLEHRLEQDGLRAARRLLEGERAGDLERDLRGVRLVILAVDERHADVDDRVARAHAVRQRLFDALLDGGDELDRDRAAADLRDEVEALAGRRLDVDVDDAVLARAAGLADEAALDLLGGAADCLAVGDLRPAGVRLDVELAAHAVDQHLEVKLAHAGDLGLAGLLVRLDLERRVLLGQAAQGDRHLLLVGLGLRLDGDLDDRLGELDHLELDRCVRGGERVAGDDLLDADARGDVAREDLRDLLAVVRVHHQDAPDPLGAARVDVEDARAGLELARVDAEVRELADERVGHDLEGQRRERRGVVGRARLLPRLVLALDLDHAADRRHVERAREVVEHGVEQRLHALVLEGGAAEDRRHVEVERRLADRRLELVDRDLGLLEDELDELVVVVGDLLEEVLARLVGAVGVVGGDVDDLELLAELVLVDDRLHADQVDDPDEVGLRPDRQLHRHGMRTEAVDHRLDGLLEVRPDAVHLVDERDARDVVLVGLAPHGLGLRLDARDGVEERDRAVEHAQRALHLDGEVDVAGRVDDVDPVVAPLAGRRGGRDRDAALLLLLHPVHRGGALVDLTDLVGATGVVEDALGRRRLTGVDVRHDPDVAGLLERKLAGHVKAGESVIQGKKNGPLGPARTTALLMLPAVLCARGLHPAQMSLPAGGAHHASGAPATDESRQ